MVVSKRLLMRVMELTAQVKELIGALFHIYSRVLHGLCFT